MAASTAHSYTTKTTYVVQEAAELSCAYGDVLARSGRVTLTAAIPDDMACALAAVHARVVLPDPVVAAPRSRSRKRSRAVYTAPATDDTAIDKTVETALVEVVRHMVRVVVCSENGRLLQRFSDPTDSLKVETAPCPSCDVDMSALRAPGQRFKQLRVSLDAATLPPSAEWGHRRLRIGILFRSDARCEVQYTRPFEVVATKADPRVPLAVFELRSAARAPPVMRVLQVTRPALPPSETRSVPLRVLASVAAVS